MAMEILTPAAPREVRAGLISLWGWRHLGVSGNTFCLNPPSWDDTFVLCGLLQRGFG